MTNNIQILNELLKKVKSTPDYVIDEAIDSLQKELRKEKE